MKFVVNSKLTPQKSFAQVLVRFDKERLLAQGKKMFPESQNEGLLIYVSVDSKQVLFVYPLDNQITHRGDSCLVTFSSCGLGVNKIQAI